jgi:hypothetical protein
MFFIRISRWAIAPVFQLLDIRREPGLSPFGYQFVSLEDSYRIAQKWSLLKKDAIRIDANSNCPEPAKYQEPIGGITLRFIL